MRKLNQPIPATPRTRAQTLMNATVTFHSPKGDVALEWSAADGDVSHNGSVVHNTNDLALLHTIAKGISAASKGKTP